jgi:hypothetical protein
MTVYEVIAVRSHTRRPHARNKNTQPKRVSSQTPPMKAEPFNKPSKKVEPFSKPKPKNLS